MRLIDADALIADWKADMETPVEDDGTFEMSLVIKVAKSVCLDYIAHVEAWPTAEPENRYAWHDLRKNPEDLPEDDGYYEVICNELCRWDNTKRLFIICMSYRHKLLYGKPIGWGVSFPYDFDFDTDEIIAWRHIEPFEVDE